MSRVFINDLAVKSGNPVTRQGITLELVAFH
jgi:hypothetical protein